MNRCKKEWPGELGYCNCLLVMMSRTGVANVELASDAPVPDLELLARARPEVAAWLHAQEFDYAALDPMIVIEALSQLTGLPPLHCGTASVVFFTYDVQEKDGSLVLKYFSLHRTQFLASTSLRVQLEGADPTSGTNQAPRWCEGLTGLS